MSGALTRAPARPKTRKEKKAPSTRKPGRPSKYQDAVTVRQARKACELGATDQDLAELFDVHVDTIAEWKTAHPEFSEALKTTKAEADARVQQSLYRRALGYSHPAVKILTAAGQVTQAPYIEHYPPDTTACIFWLKNRQPGAWRDRVEQAVSLPAVTPEGPVPGLDALQEKLARLIHVEKPTTRTEAT